MRTVLPLVCMHVNTVCSNSHTDCDCFDLNYKLLIYLFSFFPSCISRIVLIILQVLFLSVLIWEVH